MYLALIQCDSELYKITVDAGVQTLTLVLNFLIASGVVAAIIELKTNSRLTKRNNTMLKSRTDCPPCDPVATSEDTGFSTEDPYHERMD